MRAYRQMDRIGNQFDLLVVDEVHHFSCGFRDEALEMTIAAARLGLTATPHPQGAASKRLDELIGRVVFELAISDLAGSYLAPFNVLTLRMELTPEERRDYERWPGLYREAFRRYRRLNPRASWETFVRAAASSDEGRTGSLAHGCEPGDCWLTHRPNGRPWARCFLVTVTGDSSYS